MITFIIPNYDKPDLTLQAVLSLYSNTKNFNCIVVDDGSPSQKILGERLASAFPQVKYIALEKNGGFSIACNAGIKAAEGSHVVLFNNDCLLTCDAVPILEKWFESADAPGIIGALLRYPDGKIQHDGMTYLPRVPGAFVHDAKDKPRASRFCPSVTGAFYAIRAQVIKKIGGLDENFFAACEDSDYCLRAWAAGFSVWYEQELTATHAEGATRGRTAGEKRERLGREKYAREVATIQAFRNKHADEFMKMVDLKAASLNRQRGVIVSGLPALKIELGCGANPQPGYVACDARKMRGVERVFDFGAQRFPFRDGECGEILMNHSIEHVSYRALPHVLNECRRVLASGGKLIIRTPDLRFICEMYLKGEITPEWPGDEDFIAQKFGGDARKLSPAWWANVKLFAGQDYPGNEHRFCFDFDTLGEVLERYGFSDVTRYYDRPVFSPGEIYCEAVRV